MAGASCKFGDDGEVTEQKQEQCLKNMQDQSSLGEAQIPAVTGQLLRTSSTASTSIFRISDVLEHIKVGSFYEIDHSKLSSNTPEQLSSIRVVMVSEKADINVTLRFPGIHSLRIHFINCSNQNAKKLPALNEKFIMSSDLADEVLYRRISSKEIAERKNSWSFWMISSDGDVTASGGGGINYSVSKKRFCTSMLNLTGMVHWGKRRRVRFLGGHDEEKSDTLSLFVKEEGEERSFDAEEENEAKDSDEKIRQIEPFEKRNPKRKSYCSTVKKCEQRKSEDRSPIKFHGKRKDLKKSISRWSVDRYKLAEENMLKILKSKGAVFVNPILRPALRAEARKMIGDTGLLDHLLKHMAGKVAPGGTDRFRRRHNADGAMEYWLESADLVNIRKEAGVQDPYWTPQPGWKPGDNPTQDPICAREIRELRKNMAKMQEDVASLISMKHEDSSRTITPNSSVLNLNSSQEDCLRSPKEIYDELLKGKASIEGQLMQISKYIRDMEEQMGFLKSRAEDHNPSEESEEPLPPVIDVALSDTEPDTKKENQKIITRKEGEEIGEDKAAKAEEIKAAKIQRLKSGFRICKPQGTFLWPNMAVSPPHLDDHPLVVEVVHTPPSASSTTSATHFLSPPDQQLLGPSCTSPVKPLARRAFCSSTSSNVTMPPPQHPSQSIFPAKTSLLNLNEVPCVQNSDSATLSHQSKNDHVPSNHGMPSGKSENEAGEKEGSSSPASSNASMLPVKGLALSNPSPSLNYSKPA